MYKQFFGCRVETSFPLLDSSVSGIGIFTLLGISGDLALLGFSSSCIVSLLDLLFLLLGFSSNCIVTLLDFFFIWCSFLLFVVFFVVCIGFDLCGPPLLSFLVGGTPSFNKSTLLSGMVSKKTCLRTQWQERLWKNGHRCLVPWICNCYIDRAHRKTKRLTNFIIILTILMTIDNTNHLIASVRRRIFGLSLVSTLNLQSYIWVIFWSVFNLWFIMHECIPSAVLCLPDLQLRSLYHKFLLVRKFWENFPPPWLVLCCFLCLWRRGLEIHFDKILGAYVSVSCRLIIVFLAMLPTFHVQITMR